MRTPALKTPHELIWYNVRFCFCEEMHNLSSDASSLRNLIQRDERNLSKPIAFMGPPLKCTL